jgi:hypothetical protein
MATAAAFALPSAANASAIITIGTTAPIPTNNDFRTQLGALGFTQYTYTGADVVLNANSTLTFEYLAAESYFNDIFTAGSVNATEFFTYNNSFASPVLLGSDNFLAGSLIGQLNFSSQSIFGVPATIGDIGFAIFLPTGATGTWNTNVFYIGYDDFGAGPDDNHDDFIIRVTVNSVPEPATWAMMLTGFAAVGFALRRRKRPAALPQIA